MSVGFGLRAAPKNASPDASTAAGAPGVQGVVLPRRGVLDGLVREMLLPTARMAGLHRVLRVPVSRRGMPLGLGRCLIAAVRQPVADAGAPGPQMPTAAPATTLVVVTPVVADDVVPLGRRRRRRPATLVHGVVVAIWSGEGGRLVAAGPVGLVGYAIVVRDSSPNIGVAILVPA